MHRSSMVRMEWFVNNYIKEGRKKVLDIGSYNVNGCYKGLFYGKDIEYVGLDIEEGPNVDVVMDSPYNWTSIEDESFDYIISGQAFEHIEYPWLTMKEIYKKLKPEGIICIIAPSSTEEHRYPFDCYRFFSDGLGALAEWANFEILDVSVAGIPKREVSPEWYSIHNDVCLIARKNQESKKIVNVCKLNYERRYNWRLDQQLTLEFLSKWIEQKNIEKMFEKFIGKEKVKKVYIYGQDYTGKILYNKLKNNKNIAIEFIGQKLLNDEIIELPNVTKLENNSMMIIALLDHNRDLKRYLDTVYGFIPKYYADEFLDIIKFKKFFKKYEQVYLYGAGNFGEKHLELLSRYDLKPKGFIVSEQERTNVNFCGLKVYELQELQQREKIGIIIAVSSKWKDSIEGNLIEQGYKNYIMGCEYLNVSSIVTHEIIC